MELLHSHLHMIDWDALELAFKANRCNTLVYYCKMQYESSSKIIKDQAIK